jgi:hypothetical protein
MKKLSTLILLLTVLVFSAMAASYQSEDYYYTIDLPSGWELSDESDATQIVFGNADDDAAVVVGVFEAEEDLSNDELLQAVVDKMRLKGTQQAITFKGFKAVAGSYQFTLNDSKLTADIVIFRTRTHYFMIMGSSLKETYKGNRSDIKEIVNSFTLDLKALTAAYSDEVEDKPVKKPVNNTKTTTTTKTTATTKTTTDKTADPASQYSISIDWKDLATSFTFLKTDYNTAVKEGKAIVASGDMWGYYGVDTENDPHYTETFWGRFFQDMYNKNYLRVAHIVAWFKDKAKEKGWSDYELATEVIKCVQTIPYERPYQVVTDQTQAASVLDYFTPNEIAWYNKGDCDTKSLLIIMILRQLGYDLVMYFSEEYSHAMAGININAKGTYKTNNGKKYYFIEATYPGWNIGDLPKEFGDPAKWTLVIIE